MRKKSERVREVHVGARQAQTARGERRPRNAAGLKASDGARAAPAHATRAGAKPLKALHVPSSVVAGALGLVAVQAAGAVNAQFAEDTARAWRSWPGVLINIIFGTMFLGVRLPSGAHVARVAGGQLCYGLFISWGQWAVALGVTLIAVVPIWNVNPLIATCIPVGFAGGHGTAGGLVETYTELGFPSGSDLGLLAATIGLVAALAMGVAAIAIARTTGRMPVRASGAMGGAGDCHGVIPPSLRQSAGQLTVPVEEMDTFSLHVAFAGVTVAIGIALKEALVGLENLSDGAKKLGLAASLPLFPMCMLAGIAVQSAVSRAFGESSPIDRDVIDRVSNLSLDYLVASAIGGLDLQTVSTGLAPILFLIVTGLAWNAACLFLFAPWMFADHVYERGVVEMGQNTGVVATGLLLLRMADPNNSTGVLDAFVFKQLVHSSLMGGGLWTVTGVVLTHRLGPFPVFCISAIVTALSGFISAFVLAPSARRLSAARVEGAALDNPLAAPSESSFEAGLLLAPGSPRAPGAGAA